MNKGLTLELALLLCTLCKMIEDKNEGMRRADIWRLSYLFLLPAFESEP
ncbi:hypothetical protein BAGQ_0885 [Bacillus velezensis]|nr:hypothetical protein BCBMB205_08110 [Bacillus velezensis]ARZ57140.1 hypothetical protein BAGQ_0885 [Bacillus velezensis]